MRPLTKREIEVRKEKLERLPETEARLRERYDRVIRGIIEAQKHLLSQEIESGVRKPPGLRYLEYRKAFYAASGLRPVEMAYRDFETMMRGYVKSTEPVIHLDRVAKWIRKRRE